MVHSPGLREPFDRRALARRLRGRTIESLRRRSKYLLVDVSGGSTLAIHLGMSGRLTLVPVATAREPHEHLALLLDGGERLRLRDPRRFGLALALPTTELDRDRHFAHLGREPLSPPLTGADLEALAADCRGPVKNFLMDGRRVVGVGNIYATEALFRARVRPDRSVRRIGRAAWDRVAESVVAVLEQAIRQGGTTLNDFTDGAGNEGYFQVSLAIYGREGEACPRCGSRIRRLVQAGRSSFCCLRCQR